MPITYEQKFVPKEMIDNVQKERLNHCKSMKEKIQLAMLRAIFRSLN